MKKIIFISLCHLTLLSFGQQKVAENRLIRGFVFDNSYFSSIPLPVDGAPIEIIGTGRKTTADDCKFEIQAKEGDTLIISGQFIKTKKVLITDKNCYEINLDTVILDDLMSFPSKKAARQNSRYYRKLVKKVREKIDSGFYNCFD